MNNNAIEIFEKDTTVRLPKHFIDTIVTEIGSEKRQLHLPCHFQQEIRLIQNDIAPKKQSLSAIMVRGLSAASMVSLEIALNYLSIVQFGFMPVLAYYLSTPAVATCMAIRKTLIHPPSTNLGKRKSKPLAQPISSNQYLAFMIHFEEYLAYLKPINTKAQNIAYGFSRKITAAKLELAFKEYLSALEPNQLKAGIAHEFTVPKKTGFTNTSKNDYLATKVEQEVIIYFRNTLRKFARILIDELPRDITQNESLSWIQKGIRSIQRLLEPLTLPYYFLVEKKHFNPLRLQIVATVKSTQSEDFAAKSSQEKKSELISTMVQHAHEIYQIECDKRSIQEREAEHRKTLETQEEIIREQERKILDLQHAINRQKSTKKTTC